MSETRERVHIEAQQADPLSFLAILARYNLLLCIPFFSPSHEILCAPLFVASQTQWSVKPKFGKSGQEKLWQFPRETASDTRGTIWPKRV
jgi:hypothetical protein